jgi:hypothetical protein
LIRCTVLEPTLCALIVLRRLRPARRSRRIAASFRAGIRGRPKALALRLGARHAGLDPPGDECALEFRQQKGFPLCTA